MTTHNVNLPQSAVIWGKPEHSGEFTCAHCGQAFQTESWQPRMRCPHCFSLGYPDRAGSNFLPLNWECPSCGTLNDGSVNFCLTCGTGLASRCMRCENPIYTAICEHCGARQADLQHYSDAGVRRDTWVPDLHQQIKQDIAKKDLRKHQNYNPMYGVSDWRKIDTQMKQSVVTRQQRHQNTRLARQAKRRPVVGWLVFSGGVVALIAFNLDAITPVLGNLFVQINFQNWLAEAESIIPPGLMSFLNEYTTWIMNWWGALQASFDQPLGADDPEYAYLFGIAVFGMAVLPLLFFLLGKIIRKLFP